MANNNQDQDEIELTESTHYYQVNDNNGSMNALKSTFISKTKDDSDDGSNYNKTTSNKSVKKKKEHTSFLSWFKSKRNEMKERTKQYSTQYGTRLATGPIDKLLRYGRFPWKLIIHVILLVVITVEIVLFTQTHQAFFLTVDATFSNTFLPAGFESIESNVAGHYTSYLLEYEDVVSDIKKTVETFYEFPRKNVNIWVFDRDNKRPDLVRPPKILYKLYTNNPRDFIHNASVSEQFSRGPIIEEEDYLTADEPLGTKFKERLEKGTREFFDTLDTIELKFSLIGLDWSHYSVNNFAECIKFEVKKSYLGKQGGKLPLILTREYDVCTVTDRAIYMEFYKPVVWFALLNGLFSVVALFLDIKSVVHRFRLFQKIRKLEKKVSSPVGQSPVLRRVVRKLREGARIGIFDLPKFISPWYLFSITQHVVNIVAFFLILFFPGNIHSMGFFVGLGSLLAWCSTIRFFQFAPDFYLFTKAFTKGLPQVIRFLISALPLYFGFCMFSAMMFGEFSRYYQDMQESFITQFSLLFADNMRDTFDQLFGYSVFIAICSRVYLYIFIGIFICIVMNVFTTIMEDSFFSLREERMKEKLGSDASQEDDSSSILDGSFARTEDLEEEYFSSAILLEEEKEEDLTKTITKYFPNETTQLDVILDEETPNENLQRILDIVKRAVGDKILTDEQQKLLTEIEQDVTKFKDQKSRRTISFNDDVLATQVELE
ncbi:hypothetical protein ABK040_001757 [Willaertia magna]